MNSSHFLQVSYSFSFFFFLKKRKKEKSHQCTKFNNNSVFPDNLPKLTDKSLDLISFSTNDIAKITNNLNPNKAHGYDMLSIYD